MLLPLNIAQQSFQVNLLCFSILSFITKLYYYQNKSYLFIFYLFLINTFFLNFKNIFKVLIFEFIIKKICEIWNKLNKQTDGF